MSTLNDRAWRDLFIANNVLSDIKDSGIFHVTADTMKDYREPRLMAKIDTSELLPQVFKANDLSILPVKNGEYIIFKDPQQQSFFNFPNYLNEINITKHSPATSLSNFDSFKSLENLNEAQALDTALMSSIIKDFTHETNIWLTIRGRHFTKDFKVFIPSLEKYIDVSKVQVEIDAGYESENAIYIFEAKIGNRENFNIRQLLYPYLEWKNRTSKTVIPVFFFFTNGLYYLFQFDLGDSLDASKVIRRACYTLYDIEEFDLKRIIGKVKLGTALDKSIPFPQADDLDKVIDTVSLVNQGYVNKQDLSEILEFDERQGDYYGNAGRFLGFLDRDDNNFHVTDLGRQLLKFKSPSLRAKFIVEQLAERPVFYQIFQQLLLHDLDVDYLDSIEVSRIIEDQTDLTGSTPSRRSITVRQWIKWIYKYAK